MKRVGEAKSGGIGAKAKSVAARITTGGGKEVAQGGHGGKSGAVGSGRTKGNRNRGRTRGSKGSGGEQSQGGRSRRTNGDIARDAARDLVFSMHPQRGSSL